MKTLSAYGCNIGIRRDTGMRWYHPTNASRKRIARWIMANKSRAVMLGTRARIEAK